MIYLLKDDYFEVYLGSMITNNDKDVIYMLYQPIIGHDAVALYFSLYSEFKKHESLIDYKPDHESLANLMNLTLQRIQEARRSLEGIGLLQTFYRKDDNSTEYKYVLFAPKSPSDFFNDVLLKGLLVRNIGAKEVNRLINIYKSKTLTTDGFVEISESFTSVFHPDLDSSSFSTEFSFDKSFGHHTRDITKGFDKGLFLNSLENNYHIKAKSIKTHELDELSKLALLYGVEEELLSEYVAQAVRPDGVDLECVRKLCVQDQTYSPIKTSVYKSKEVYGGRSESAQRMEIMSTMSAFDFLKMSNNNTMPSPSDINIINELSSKYGLTSQVINPLIHYVLSNYDNMLPTNLVYKIASSLARSGITTTVDAVNYLNKKRTNSKPKTVNESVNVSASQEDVALLLAELGDD